MPMRMASANEGALCGAIMNSWKSTVLSACLPPLITFMQGTGQEARIRAAQISVERQAMSVAAARAAAIDTASIAFAPNLALLGVPSSAIMAASTAR